MEDELLEEHRRRIRGRGHEVEEVMQLCQLACLRSIRGREGKVARCGSGLMAEVDGLHPAFGTSSTRSGPTPPSFLTTVVKATDTRIHRSLRHIPTHPSTTQPVSLTTVQKVAAGHGLVAAIKRALTALCTTVTHQITLHNRPSPLSRRWQQYMACALRPPPHRMDSMPRVRSCSDVVFCMILRPGEALSCMQEGSKSTQNMISWPWFWATGPMRARKAATRHQYHVY